MTGIHTLRKAKLAPLWTATFRPVNGDVPDTIRVRRLRKDVGRRHGLRCVDVRQAPLGCRQKKAPSVQTERQRLEICAMYPGQGVSPAPLGNEL
jgi:hypothetical protein